MASELLGVPGIDDRRRILVGLDGDGGRHVLCGNSRGFVAESDGGDDVLVFGEVMRDVAEDLAQHLDSYYTRRDGSATFFRTEEACDMIGIIYAGVPRPQPPLVHVSVEILPSEEG